LQRPRHPLLVLCHRAAPLPSHGPPRLISFSFPNSGLGTPVLETPFPAWRRPKQSFGGGRSQTGVWEREGRRANERGEQIAPPPGPPALPSLGGPPVVLTGGPAPAYSRPPRVRPRAG